LKGASNGTKKQTFNLEIPRMELGSNAITLHQNAWEERKQYYSSKSTMLYKEYCSPKNTSTLAYGGGRNFIAPGSIKIYIKSGRKSTLESVYYLGTRKRWQKYHDKT
jgi:hypothetical protein